MKNEKQNIKLTREAYLEISSKTTAKIANLKQESDDKILEIEGRIDALRELKEGLKGIKKNIRREKRSLSKNKKEKFSLKRALSKENRYAKRVNKAFSRGEETISKTR